MNEQLTKDELMVLDHLELRESISLERLSKKTGLYLIKTKRLLESLAKKQYAINYGATSESKSLWCAL